MFQTLIDCKKNYGQVSSFTWTTKYKKYTKINDNLRTIAARAGDDIGLIAVVSKAAATSATVNPNTVKERADATRNMYSGREKVAGQSIQTPSITSAKSGSALIRTKSVADIVKGMFTMQ